MGFQDILYEKKNGVARITINRPHVLNAFTNVTMLEMVQAFNDAAIDDSVGVVVLTGAGDRAFCSGGDVKWELERGTREMYDHVIDLHNAMRLCLKPVIARINGYAIGGGHHLAYFCDLSIAAEHAIFGQNGPRVGSPADGFIVSYLVRVVGAKKAREIWYLCRRYTAQEALQMGLVNAVVPYEKLDEEVDRWCEEILEKSPTCISILKASFEHEIDYMREPLFSIQRQIAPKFFETEEPYEGARAFLEKRPPNFRRFRGLPPRT
ncbi:MAG: enoyl-CoA hydratase/isomerase family protein [Clostridia bacterium]|nr:enoyl-CoA hydratase/isomerase family protein [Clostridia bacterium]